MQISKQLQIIFITSMIGVIVQPVLASTVILDPSFGNNGIVLTSPAAGAGPGQANGMVRQIDGKLVVVGSGNGDFAVARYNVDGSLDATFGNDGLVQTDINATDIAYAVKQQVDNKLVVLGVSANTYSPILVRYNTDGSIDTSFGSSGIATMPGMSGCAYYSNGTNLTASSLAQQTDGKWLVVGLCSGGTSKMARLTADGAMDNTFGSSGVVIVSTSVSFLLPFLPYSIAVQADGRIIVSGCSNTTQFGFTCVDFSTKRYSSSGVIDTSFGTNGVVTTNTSGNDGAATVAVQPDGKILVAGGSSSLHAELMRYNSDGTLDNSFGTNGVVQTNIVGASGAKLFMGLGLQTDGRILLTGYVSNGVDLDVVLLRYNPDGGLDTTFDGDGMLMLNLGAIEQSRTVIPQPNGKIVVAGTSNISGSYQFLLARFELKNTKVDFNKDGDSDIFWLRSDTNQAQTWLMQGGVRSSLNDLGYYASKWNYAGMGDFNADGDKDILLRDTATGENFVLAIENGLKQSGASIGYNSATLAVQAVGDLDGDGDDDILLRNNSTSEFKGNFMQNHVSAGTSTLGYNKTTLAFKGLADVDGDGDKDIVQRDDTTAEIKVQKLQGGVNTGPVSFGYNTVAHSFKAVLDADGDGDDDFLLRKDGDGSMIVVVNQGGTRLQVNNLGYNSTALSFTAVGDFDGDGDQDILLRNNTTGELVTVMLQNASKVSGGSIGFVATRFSFVGTGDFDGDGDDDLLFRDSATGENVRVAMQNGANVLQGQLNANNVNLVPHLK